MFECWTFVAVADHRQPQARLGLLGLRHGSQEQVEALDRDDAADEDQEDRFGVDSQLTARGEPRRLAGLGERLEVEPERDDTEPLRRSDPEPHQVVDGCLADPDQAIADPSQPPLQLEVEPRLCRAEVTLQDMPVIGVDDDRAGTDHQPSLASQEARLRGVGVDDVRLESPSQTDQLQQRVGVTEGLHRLAQLGHEAHRRALRLRQLGQRRLPCSQRAMDEERLVTVGVEAPAAEQRGLVGRPTHVEATDDSQDA